MRTFTLSVLVAAAPAFAQQSAWAQCGGTGFTGGTTCVSGYTCKYSNDYYSQCVPGSDSGSAATTLATSAKPTPTGTTSGGSSYPWWFGINLSGAEFGQNNFSGVYGKEFTWYDKSSIDTLIGKGMNMFRINFLMERVTPGSLTGTFDRLYVGNLTDVSANCTKWLFLLTVDKASQLHYREGRICHDPTSQLWPFSEQYHYRYECFPNLVEESCNAL
jgi:endoglucanase